MQLLFNILHSPGNHEFITGGHVGQTQLLYDADHVCCPRFQFAV